MKIVFGILLLLFTSTVFAQPDSLPVLPDTPKKKPADTTKGFITADSMMKVSPPISNKSKIDSILLHHSPRKAAIRSALLPGLGQIYNKKYWKLPIVYGALGISGSVFVYNLQWYRRTRFAYKTLTLRDTPNFVNVHPQLQVFINRNDAQSLQSYRNEFRRNIDYSVIVFLLLWGLNVVDATVDAHLKSFDVSPDLSFKMKFGQSEMAGTTGVSLVLAFK